MHFYLFQIFDLYTRRMQSLGYDVSITVYDRLNTNAKASAKFAADTGIRRAEAYVRGQGVYRTLKYDCGVHRVQRVPVTGSKNDRLQTSTCSMAVVPLPDDSDIELPEKELKCEFMRSGGPGGQSANTMDSACRVIHLPTGLTASSEQHK